MGAGPELLKGVTTAKVNDYVVIKNGSVSNKGIGPVVVSENGTMTDVRTFDQRYREVYNYVHSRAPLLTLTLSSIGLRNI